VVCLDADGRPNFKALFFRRAEPFYYCFDVVWLDGVDQRDTPLIERKRILRRLLHRAPDPIRYLGHVRGRACNLFSVMCAHDLEGVVAKLARSPYRLLGDDSPWLKIKNRDYSQARDRHELFEPRRRTSGTYKMG
jgi:bifunctional non-homologous end joining protein LigD